jgi:predicted Zn-dependent protease
VPLYPAGQVTQEKAVAPLFIKDAYKPSPSDAEPPKPRLSAQPPAIQEIDGSSDVEKASWTRRLLAGFFLGTTILGLAGCGGPIPQPPGGSSTSISTDLSYLFIDAKAETALGNQVAAQIEKTEKLWHNQEAQARINRLGADLAKTSTRKDITYSFKLIDSDTVNAFALPGGHIYATRGLMQEFRDDRELAFILGHEMGHIEDRDAIKNIERDVAFRQLLEILTRKQGDLAKIAGQLAKGFMNVRFSQKDEFQADELAARHLARAGINPWYGVRAMEHLQGLEKTRPSAIEKLFSTHPPTAERVEHLRRYAEGHPQP